MDAEVLTCPWCRRRTHRWARIRRTVLGHVTKLTICISCHEDESRYARTETLALSPTY